MPGPVVSGRISRQHPHDGNHGHAEYRSADIVHQLESDAERIIIRRRASRQKTRCCAGAGLTLQRRAHSLESARQTGRFIDPHAVHQLGPRAAGRPGRAGGTWKALLEMACLCDVDDRQFGRREYAIDLVSNATCCPVRAHTARPGRRPVATAHVSCDLEGKPDTSAPVGETAAGPHSYPRRPPARSSAIRPTGEKSRTKGGDEPLH